MSRHLDACGDLSDRGRSEISAYSAQFGVPDQSSVRAFEKRAFDRDQPMALREAFPASIPIPPRARELSEER